MKPEAFVVTPQDYPRAMNVLGVQITVLAPNTATRGYEVTLQEGDEGVGPPPHSHPWDESFFVMRGKVEFSCAGKTVLGLAGSLVHVPAGSGGGAMIEFSGAGGSATKMFTQVAREVPPGPPDVPKLIDILQNHGVTVAA
jgi:hypothetical protein